MSKQKWKFRLYKVNDKTKQVELATTCKTKEMSQSEMEMLVKIEMAKYKFDFWELL